MLVAASLAAFVYARQSDHSESTLLLSASGILAGLSILACQYNVVLIPALSLGALLRDREIRIARAIPRLLKIWIPLGGVVGTAFIAVGISVYGLKSVSSLMNWGSNYSGNRLPMWGVWWPPSRARSNAGKCVQEPAQFSISGCTRESRGIYRTANSVVVLDSRIRRIAALLIAAFRKGTATRSVGESSCGALAADSICRISAVCHVVGIHRTAMVHRSQHFSGGAWWR
jgi:hypothetical protein